MKEQSSNKEKTKETCVHIGTMVRLRPLLDSQSDEKQSIAFLNEKTLEIKMSGGKRKQTAQAIFSSQCTQREVFEKIQPFIKKCNQGFNVTVFTYGQTGSGKTYTMFGSDWNNILKKHASQKSRQSTFLRSIQQDENHAGLIPRAVSYVFSDLIEKRRKHIKIFCSFLQLYNEQMMDLFEDDKKKMDKKMLIHENKQDGIYVEGLNQVQIENVEHCLQLMQKGERNRIVRQTHMNIKSSRSHTIFQLLIEEVFPDKKNYRRMKLNLCDLAGSEKINKTEKMQQQHLDQLKNINLSLTTLGKVIGSLSEKDSSKTLPAYRESKLTRLLQDSLGGNTFTVIIATITSKSACMEQSINTLKFLERAKQIKTSISAKIFSDNPDMRNLQKQIAYLKDILKIKRTGVQIDINFTDKMKRLQAENQKLKDMVDKQLVEKLMRQNTQLRQQLSRKNNDDLMVSQNGSGQFKTVDMNLQSRQFELDLIKQSQPLEKTQKTSDIVSSYSSSNKIIQKDRKFLSTNTYTTKHNQSLNSSQKANSTKFPSIKTIGASKKSPTSILQRIHEIQRVKQANKLKLEHELSMVGSADKGSDSSSGQRKHGLSSNGYPQSTGYSQNRGYLQNKGRNTGSNNSNGRYSNNYQ